MALGQSNTSLIDQQRTVIERREWQAQRPIEQLLTGRGNQQISAPNHLGDLHGRIIHHDGKLVRRNPIMPPDHEIPEILPRHKGLGTQASVDEGDCLAIRGPETPVPFELMVACSQGWLEDRLMLAGVGKAKPATQGRPASPWINRFLFGRMRCLQSALHIAARAATRINETPIPEDGKGRLVGFRPCLLRVGRKRPTAVGSFLPMEPEPTQVFDHGRDEFRAATVTVEILVAQDEDAATRLRPLLCHPERPGMAQVQIARGRGGQTATVDATGAGGRRHHPVHLACQRSEVNSICPVMECFSRASPASSLLPA